MSPQTCYCINPDCRQPGHPSNLTNNFCNNCGSRLILNDKYRVKRLLSNNSGFGLIYQAESDQPKILKVLKPEFNHNSKVIDLFQQEFKVLLTLTQQGITGIPQVESDDYFQYQTKTGLILHCIVMEKVEGVDLLQWVKNNGQVSQKQAIKWLREITQILAKIHQQNYFHRDIKPPNIMQRLNGELVLIDFGTAREETKTYYQKLGGQYITGIESPGYTPDEQKNGQAVVQSDFFALGRTFVHLLTGKFPLEMYDGYNNILNWREHTENINPMLLNFIDELMAVSVRNRPANTEVILQKIAEIEGGITHPQPPTIPIYTVPPTPPPTQKKEVKSVKSILLKLIPASLLLLGIGYGVKEYGDININITPSPEPTINIQLTDQDYFNQGLEHSQKKEYQEAIADFNSAIKLNSNYTDAFIERGLAYYYQQEYQPAISDYNRAIQINPDYAIVYNNRGLAYAGLKQYQQAIADYTESIRLNNPELFLPYNNRGIAYSSLQQYQPAIEDFNAAIQINPNYANSYNGRGLAYYYQQEYQQAILDYNSAITLDPNHAIAYNNRGIVYRDLKEYEQAIADYTKSIELNNPELWLPYKNRGNVYYDLQEYEKAIEDQSQAISFNPSYADAYYDRGLAYQVLGNSQNALSDFRKAASLYQEQGNTEWYDNTMDRIAELGG